jgi:putative oxidoreductase
MEAGEMLTKDTRMCGDSMRYVALAARQLFAVTFIIASAGHFTADTIASAARHGVPLAGLLVPLSGLIALAGGLSLVFGYHVKLGACLLMVFLVPVTLMMHNFWAASDAAMFQQQLLLFVRNTMLMGAAMFVVHFGGGSLSLDALLAGPSLDALIAEPVAELDYVA